MSPKNFLPVSMFLLFASSLLLSQDEVVQDLLPDVIEPKDAPHHGHFTDQRDSKNYKTIDIGNQTWMAENLSYLPAVSPLAQESATKPLYYVYGYDGSDVKVAEVSDNFKNYGALYNWPAAHAACPEGWHIPTGRDWDELINYLGHISVAGNKIKATGTMHWKESNESVTNASGFHALPGGAITAEEGMHHLHTKANFWSDEARHANTMASKSLSYRSSWVEGTYFPINSGLSVRCLKN